MRSLDARARHLLAHWPLDAPVVRAQEIRRLRNECGCGAGAVALLIVTPVTVVGLARDAHGLGTWGTVGIGFGAALASMAAGKLVGMALARVRLARRVAALEKLVRE